MKKRKKEEKGICTSLSFGLMREYYLHEKPADLVYGTLCVRAKQTHSLYFLRERIDVVGRWQYGRCVTSFRW